MNGLWDQLLKRPKRRSFEPDHAKTGTMTAQLLNELRDGPAATQDLASRFGLHSKAVWGLLKVPRDQGIVHYAKDSGQWTFNHDHPGVAVERAAHLLRSLGWKVSPPDQPVSR